jgi:hypothetical protein
MDLISSAKIAQLAAVVSGTSEKHECTLSRWKLFLQSVGIYNDFYLDQFSPPEQEQLLSAFMEAIRNNKINKYKHHRPPPVKVESCASSLGNLAQAFTASDHQDPRLARDGKLTFLLRHQIKGYSNLDPSKSSQQALPVCILQYLYSTAITNIEKASAELLIDAFFFTMRSCEYCEVYGEKKTKLLMVKNFSFYKNNKLLNIHNKSLHEGNFESQKTEKKNQAVFHPRLVLFPVLTTSVISTGRC